MDIQKELHFYQSRTKQSNAASERAKKFLPGGICHEIRSYAPYPIVIESSQGPYLTDIDKNRYVDYWMGHYTHILGHNPAPIVEALGQQLEQGIMWGCIHEKEIQLAELICQLVPCAEEIRFCTSGTEATMYAVRLARGYTGKNLVLKMEGGWHGPSSELFHGVTRHFDSAESLGLVSDGTSAIQTIPFNDLERCRQILKSPAMADLAAIIVEPLLGSSWFLPAQKEFLSLLRQECSRLHAVLIYDEIISGFRVALGGAQEYFGIYPDLTTLGKVLGGGMPMAAVAGREEIMEKCNPGHQLPKWERVRIGGGTFSCHPLSIAAALALLHYLKQNKNQIYPWLRTQGLRLRERITQIMTAAQIPVSITGLDSLFTIHFLKQEGNRLRSPRDALENCHYHFKEGLFKIMLLNRGVYVMHGGGALSMAHTDQELERTYQALEEVVSLVAPTWQQAVEVRV